MPPPDADHPFAKPRPPQTSLGVEALVGLNGRLDTPSSGYSPDERAALLGGAGVFFSPNRMFAFGLSYQRAGAGAEQYSPGPSLANGKISRVFQSALANVRAYPFRNDQVGVWAGLMLGATWQTAHATGVTSPVVVQAVPPTYSTDAGPSAGLAMGLGVGFDYDASENLGFLGSFNLTNHRLTSDPLVTTPVAVPGSGNTTVLDMRVAFQYRFDLGGAASLPPASEHASIR